MKDYQIREILHKTELNRFYRDGVSKVVDEMKIPAAKARIDVAVINGSFHGYEIKGASDTLNRLPNQIIAYSYIFDYLTIITEEKHCKKIVDLAPSWVGVLTCQGAECNSFSIHRHPSLNPSKEKFYIAKLLWKEELVEVLMELKIPFKKKSRSWTLCELLAQNIEQDLLSDIVRNKMKKRQNWKSS